MSNISIELILILLSGVVILSYLFTIIGKWIRLPSVLLLLLAGVGIRVLANDQEWGIIIPSTLTQMLGAIGLIMIVLEAGLDLKLNRSKLPLIRSSFLSAFFILILTSAGIAYALQFFMQEPLTKCIVYAIPLAIMSSSIVIPSLHHLSASKKEFLVYEASFSDIIGILFFNLFIEETGITWFSAGSFLLNIVIALLLSLMLSLVLFFILTKNKLNIKFFLIFALLIALYEGGKMLHLPSLIIILVFGLMMNNFELLQPLKLHKYFPEQQAKDTVVLMHSLTAEASFLIRTFFFILFGYSIDITSIMQEDVIIIGSLIVFILLLTRFLYLRFFLKENVFPEVFYIPRGLITILLFYKIPAGFKLESFSESILFFVVLATGVIMTLGMIFYKHKPEQLVEENY